MKVANPIYDVVFKYLMKDTRVAKLVISNIIEQEIESLDFGFTELDKKKSDGSLTVLRIDFTAKIREADGSIKLVLIELQKAKFPTDITRFRQYLGKQYQEESNIYIDEQSRRKRAMPIISIYILGHNLQYNDNPVIQVKRDYYDQATREKLAHREEFIESLTHDSYIIQVQRLRKKHRNKLETLLSVFDQSNTSRESKHFLDLLESAYPDEFKIIIRRLQKAFASKELCEDMDMEDDFLEELSDDSNLFYNEFVESFNELPERMYLRVAKGYVAGIRYDPASVLRFLVIFGEKAKGDSAIKLFNILSSRFVDELSKLPGAAVLSAQMLHAYPKTLNSFLALLEWDTLARFVILVHNPPALPELPPIYEQLRALADIHFQSSHFFKRYFHPVLNKFSVFIKNLHNNDKLKEITDGFYSDLTSLQLLEERIERLGDYYDLEFVRVSLLAMAGAGCERTDAEFIEFCDNYTLLLYEFCQQDVRMSIGYTTRSHDVFAIYATGGHAREQGFDDDYDMIVILDSTDPDEIDYFNKIVGKMNSHILKRGILPHHHFADHYGSYVISVDQLSQHLSGKGEEIFVDQSQILSSRILVGSSRLERKLQQDIITPYIFARSREYIRRMRIELTSRHSTVSNSQTNDIKECRGGLRDIEMLLLMYKVKHKVRDPLSRKFLKRLSEIEPEQASDFMYMEQHLNFLKNLRDLYRLKVAASDIIDREYLTPVAESIQYGKSAEAAQKLYNDFLERCEEASGIIEKLVTSIKL
ncbi:MAG: hypothetical protein U9R56_08360 [candidate division Zixibacteria bacterium]|nr:hypothetical protein [candidate division Zixibacteria bacterium]